MQTTLAGIKQILKEKIEALETVSDEPIFQAVYDYPTADFSLGYPAAVLTFTGGQGEVIDTHRNERTYNFILKLYQEQSEQGKTPEEADEIMTDAFDQVIKAFDEDKDLSGEVELVRVVEFETDFTDRPGTYNFATFEINCIVVVQNYS